MANKETVVLLHGMLRGRSDMWPMRKYLEYHGYNVLNLSYSPRKYKIPELASEIDAKIKRHKKYDPQSRLHFVGHSLGGLIARYYIRDFTPQNLGRVVMMGTPNAGSEWADHLLQKSILRPFYRIGFGAVGPQLMTTHHHGDDKTDVELGIIAGSKTKVPFANHILPSPHDGVVTVERTKLPHMKDHIVLDATHSFMMVNPKVMRQVASFLKTGQFTIAATKTGNT